MNANNNADWIEWKGGECPVPGNTQVRICLRNGFVTAPAMAHDKRWQHNGSEYDLTAYKVEKPAADPAPAKFDHKEYLAAENERLLEASKIEATARLRDEFAMAALTGLLVGQQYRPTEVLAFDAYSFADAMLGAREVKP